MAASQSKRSVHRGANLLPAAPNCIKSTNKRSNTLAPSAFTLRPRTLPGRRLVQFPLVKGKSAEKLELSLDPSPCSLRTNRAASDYPAGFHRRH